MNIIHEKNKTRKGDNFSKAHRVSVSFHSEKIDCAFIVKS